MKNLPIMECVHDRQVTVGQNDMANTCRDSYTQGASGRTACAALTLRAAKAPHLANLRKSARAQASPAILRLFFGILIVPNRARKIEMPSSASGAMTAGGRRPCVILPRQNQNNSGNNYHSNKCPCMGLHIMKTGRSVIGPCFARQGRIRYLGKCDIPGLRLTRRPCKATPSQTWQ